MSSGKSDPAKIRTHGANGPTPSPSEVAEQLSRILESQQFRTSKRCSSFLRYVVESSAEGKAELLKERTLGVAVFGRSPDYDNNQDPVVRSTAGEVRKRLAQYYHEPDREGEIRIELPSGSYVPEILAPVEKPAQALSVPSQLSLQPVVQEIELPRRFGRSLWVSVAAIGIAALAAAVFWFRPAPASDMDLFWGPLLRRPGPVILCIGQPHAYTFRPKVRSELDSYFANDGTSGKTSGLPGDVVPLNEILPAFNLYISIGDAQTITRLAVLFTRYKKETELRGGRVTTLTDLRGKPCVLVGGFNNEWTLSLTGTLRFYFENDQANNVDIVRDRLHPLKRDWQVRNNVPEQQLPMDYAIVTRVFSPTTEQPIVVAAGIRRSGTYAAGEFLTTRNYLSKALKDAPPDWAHKNMQFVIGTKLFSGNPGPPEVVSAHFW